MPKAWPKPDDRPSAESLAETWPNLIKPLPTHYLTLTKSSPKSYHELSNALPNCYQTRPRHYQPITEALLNPATLLQTYHLTHHGTVPKTCKKVTENYINHQQGSINVGAVEYGFGFGGGFDGSSSMGLRKV